MAHQMPHDPEWFLSQIPSSSAENDQQMQMLPSSSSLSAELHETPPQSVSSRVFPLYLRPSLKDRTISDKESQLPAEQGLNLGACDKTLSPDVLSCKKLLVDFLDGFVLGRDDFKDRLIKSILSSDRKQDDVSMVFIIADAGVGKSTIAGLVYRDPAVRRNFDVQGWISATEIKDEEGFLRAVVESITGISCRLCGLSELKDALKAKLASKRLFLVVDGTWNEDSISADFLLGSVNFAGRGSVILVTCTTQKIINSLWRVEFNDLGCLSEYDCWFIIKSSAIINRYTSSTDGDSLSPTLEEMGKKLVSSCDGRPLLARALGGVLISADFKGNTEYEHLKDAFRASKKDQYEILTALMPEALHRCFRYCSVFPKRHIFRKDQIIRLWMSQGFLEPEDGKCEEEIGEEYCYELLIRSLFQVRRFDNTTTEYFEMHDLVHDLLLSVSNGEQIGWIEDTASCLVANQFHHVSTSSHQPGYVIDFLAFKECRELQSLLIVERSTAHWAGRRIRVSYPNMLDDLFQNLSCLKALDLSFTNIQVLPDSIENLKSLCYLGLNSTNIRRLPESICSLQKLQTVELQECACLHELPKGLKNLLNLRHLDICRRSGYIRIPTGIEHLTCLQSLSAFCVGDGKGQSEIVELGNLVNLRGHLRIGGLRHIALASDAMKADLQNKDRLMTLTLQWSSDGRETESNRLSGELFANVLEVLKNLQPHSDIEEIIVRDYPGFYFSDWIGDPSFSRLISVVLDNCPRCERLPPLGQLKSLCHLSILRMDGVQTVSNEFRGLCDNAFTSLQTLKIHEMYNWELWDGVLEGDFPNLYNLSISRCFKLDKIPSILSLKKLSVTYCTKLLDLQSLPCLKELSIDHCAKLFCLNELPSLEKLAIHNCPNIQSVQLLPSLETLRIRSCPKLQCVQDLPHLNELSIQNCAEICSLRGLPLLEDLSISSSQNMTDFHDLPCLRQMSINDYVKMCDLGNIPSLRSLRIEGILNEYLDLSCNLQELQILELNCCSKVSNLIGLTSLESLKKLKLSQCPELRLQQLPELLYFLEVHESCSWLKTWVPLGFQEVQAIQEWRWLVREQ